MARPTIARIASKCRTMTCGFRQDLESLCFFAHTIWVWVKNRYPNWNPGKWKQRLKPVVPWWIDFEHTYISELGFILLEGFKGKPTGNHLKSAPLLTQTHITLLLSQKRMSRGTKI